MYTSEKGQGHQKKEYAFWLAQLIYLSRFGENLSSGSMDIEDERKKNGKLLTIKTKKNKICSHTG